MLRGLLICLVLIMGGCAFVDLKQREFIFRPTAEIAGTPADFGFEFEELWLPVTNSALTPAGTERIHGWWIPSATPDASAILYLVSGHSGMVTGANLLIDGGYSIQ